ncbi:hypothetical protein [Ruminococcus sp.]|uniref:hypothetical protein n=1 Tax=Ruminococcus sp. TaxID=41978 RepID=UPI0025D9F70F|nr:hypothetical protein [Ruminococcus sp.]
MNKFNRFASAAAAFALAAASASCNAPEAITFGKGAQTALTVDGYEVPAGIFIYNEMNAYQNAAYKMYYEKGSMPSVDDVKSSTIEELSASDWIQNNATNACKDFVANEKEFEKIGESLNDDEIIEIKNLASSYSSDSSLLENGVGEESVRKIIENSYKREAIFKHYYGLGAEKGCTEDELKTYYQDKTTRVKYFSISMVDENGEQYSADEKRRLNNMIDDYVKVINEEKTSDAKLKKIDECEEEYKEYTDKRKAEADAKAAEEAGETTTTTTTTTSSGTTTTTTVDPHAKEITITKYTTTTVDKNDSNDTTTTTTSAEAEASEKAYKNYNDHVFAMAYNKAEKYQYDDDTVYIIIRADIKERMTADDLWTEDKIDSLLNERYYDEFEDMMKDVVNGYTVVKNNKAYRKYTPFDLNLG